MSKKHQSTCCPVAKHSKHSKLSIDNIPKISAIFLVVFSQYASLAFAKMLLIYVPLLKFSFL